MKIFFIQVTEIIAMTYVYQYSTRFDEGFKFSYKVQNRAIKLKFTIFMHSFLKLFSPPHKKLSYSACHIKKCALTLRFLLFSFQILDL